MGLLSKSPVPLEPKVSLATSPVPKPIEAKPITMTFGNAMGEILNKKKITRVEWNDPEEYGFMKDEFLAIHTKGKDNRWLVSEADMISVDWIVIQNA